MIVQKVLGFEAGEMRGISMKYVEDCIILNIFLSDLPFEACVRKYIGGIQLFRKQLWVGGWSVNCLRL